MFSFKLKTTPKGGCVMTTVLTIDAHRLWRHIMEMARIGATANGGSCRLALTDQDKAGRDLFIQWCREQGCAITLDRMGNIFAHRPGRDDTLPPIACGSHLDTQPHGGKFDGVFGVLAGLEVIQTLNDHRIETQAPLEVCVWTNEEGSRFAPPMISSGVFGGAYSLDFGISRRDADGISLGEALDAIGYAGEQPCGEHAFGAFLEIHIEQGPVLERCDKPIGVVTGVQGSRWFNVILTGQDAHTGSTPMPGRRDALVGAAQAMLGIRKLALRYAPAAVATVGRIDVIPNSHNTIAGTVSFTVDMRNPSAPALDAMEGELQEILRQAADGEGLELSVKTLTNTPPITFAANVVTAVTNAADELALPWMEMISGAGHDACHISQVAPTGMVFVPCEGGLSHNEAEHAKPADLAAGTNVLLHAMLALAGR